MEILKAILVLIVLSAALTDANEARKGRCGGDKEGDARAHHLKRKPHQRKTIPFHHNSGHKFKFNQNNGASASTSAGGGGFKNQQPPNNEQSTESGQTFGNANAQTRASSDSADDEFIFSSFGASPRISISDNGDVYKGRSLQFTRHFHDEDHYEHEHDHDNHDENHDQFHKIRTARARSTYSGNPEGLNTSLNNLQTDNQSQAQNLAGSNNNQYLTATGNSITGHSSGSSNSQGSGVVNSSGTTTVTNGRTPNN